WLREGSLVDAVRASIALPGVFTPVMVQERLLVDGGLVNPVPVTLARAMGADIVIAVDLNRDILQRHLQPPDEPALRSPWLQSIQNTLGGWLPDSVTDIVSSPLPSMLEVLATSINIMQERITRSRMAGDPPDMVIAPRLAHLSLMDFHRAQEAIDVGRQATEFLLPVMQPWVNMPPPEPVTACPAPVPGASDVLADVPPPVVDAS
ncbi:MAG: patatin, partial [Ramlibacter sp.]|nr:patatin [Ramlibacter sp.]